MPSSKEFLDAIKSRRSIYAINDSSPISDAQIEDIVNNAVLHTPSSFNSQSTRLIVLLKDDHRRFWDLVKEALRPLVPAEQFGATEKKLTGFRGGYGSVLFYEDQKTVAELEAQYAIYADRFQPWSEHTSAMHQLVLWTALELEGFGANLQHYNPIVDAKAAETWGVPEGWALKAQLVFGGKVADATEKSFKSLDDRVKIYGK